MHSYDDSYRPFNTEPCEDKHATTIRRVSRNKRNHDNSHYISYKENPSNNVTNNAIIQQYQEEIARLKAKNITLKHQNQILLNELNKSQMNKKKSNEEESIQELLQYLGISSKEEIIPRLQEIINSNNETALRDEFISKLNMLYIELTGKNSNNNNVNIKELWSWIKQLINTIKDLLIEREQNERIKVTQKENNLYQEYCTELIKRYNLNSIFELKQFINSLLLKNTINKKRVEKLQKVLSNEAPFSNSKI